ncbi:MAG TPA: amidohydrolase [Candidatus Aminicenantes bacterium]|nr:amidohydrolase [Candidatus Aminicenantes bacterium]
MCVNDVDLEQLVQLRHHLHAHPELSGKESGTARTIQAFILGHSRAQVMQGLGGHGLAAVFEGPDPGPTVLFRADLDALPINEQSDAEHRSRVNAVAHLCGHDGHMAILCGLAMHLSRHCPQRGRVVLLFQPAEETGTGAARVIADPGFEKIRPDIAFALHNLPGFPKGSVVWRYGPFASASRGLIMRLTGRTAHAGEPENGVTPAPAVSRLLAGIPALPGMAGIRGFGLATVVHARLGEVAFGTAPGEAVVMATLRTHTDRDMDRLFAAGEQLARETAAASGLKIALEAVEDFPATINDRDAVERVRAAAQAESIPMVKVTQPFRWSEDFAHFTRLCPAALFGLGAGEDGPRLHNPEYAFPDELIKPGVAVFAALSRGLLGEERHDG